MTDYTELIRSLRCENTGDDECGSSDCPYWSGLGCMDGQLMEDAADAIEALQAQLPKRGEWVYKPKDAIEMMYTLPKCSVCGNESSDANNYCPNCGAKMREVQE